MAQQGQVPDFYESSDNKDDQNSMYGTIYNTIIRLHD